MFFETPRTLSTQSIFQIEGGFPKEPSVFSVVKKESASLRNLNLLRKHDEKHDNGKTNHGLSGSHDESDGDRPDGEPN